MAICRSYVNINCPVFEVISVIQTTQNMFTVDMIAFKNQSYVDYNLLLTTLHHAHHAIREKIIDSHVLV